VWVCADGKAVARAAARQFLDLARQFTASSGRFCVALSGGTTPRTLHRLLASDEYRSQIDWDHVHLFWGDERSVAPESPESNYGMARREWIARVPIPQGNVHRMETERPRIERAAREYETLLRRHLDLDAAGWPRFHLILLGIGPDGHTASFFPGARGVRTTRRWVATPMVAQLGARRMTLTLPVLNAAHNGTFLVLGKDKAEILRAVLEGRKRPAPPARLVTIPSGRRTFFVDRAAAAFLEP
jgi:6-phosphogluconolactonase